MNPVNDAPKYLCTFVYKLNAIIPGEIAANKTHAKKVELNLVSKNKDSSNPQTIRQSLLFAGSILGVFNKEPSEWNKQIEISNSEIAEIDKLIIQRKALKENKDFAGADAIRDSLLEKGIELIDSEDGTTWKSKS